MADISVWMHVNSLARGAAQTDLSGRWRSACRALRCVATHYVHIYAILRYRGYFTAR
ncbi:hypothetical protein KCP70_23380 [Salmonella enterica subsp. enterica]|nr:hypothetical protein KCP70_23380 [Salmonella enterica subsp. enterica]